MDYNINYIENEINETFNNIKNHDIKNVISSIEDIQVCSEKCIFSIWDYFTLSKYLESSLRNFNFVWLPNKNAESIKKLTNLINKEEFDYDINGNIKSHFEMFIEAMEEIAADTSDILNIINHSKYINLIEEINLVNYNTDISIYNKYIYSTIKTGKPHLMAGILAYSKDFLITDLLIKKLNEIDSTKKFKKLHHILNRIKLSNSNKNKEILLQIVSNLIGDDKEKLEETSIAIKSFLRYRTLFLNDIVFSIEKQKNKDLYYNYKKIS